MKGITELALGAVLLMFVYDKPAILTELSNSLLGKLVLIVCVIMIAKSRGLAAGLLAALIMVTLMHSTIEGLDTRSAAGAHCQPTLSGKPVSCLSGNPAKPDDSKCGVARAVCTEQGQCKAVIDPKFEMLETEAAKDVSTFDVRLAEGMNNINSRRATIEAMKFQNGFTGNREPFKGFI